MRPGQQQIARRDGDGCNLYSRVKQMGSIAFQASQDDGMGRIDLSVGQLPGAHKENTGLVPSDPVLQLGQGTGSIEHLETTSA